MATSGSLKPGFSWKPQGVKCPAMVLRPNHPKGDEREHRRPGQKRNRIGTVDAGTGEVLLREEDVLLLFKEIEQG